jgi:thymidylate synthase
MLTIKGENINDLYPIGIMYLREQGVQRESRNGPTLEIMEPVAVTYEFSDERVLFDTIRDANPFFHLFESLWMLAGRADVAFVKKYNSNIGKYSDDGINFNSAYGYRLRHQFGFDQLEKVISMLRINPDDRRAVLQLSDPVDLKRNTLDQACNLIITPRVRGGVLDWTVFNRSNDYLWGLAGANVVHMSIIQEYVARMIGIEPGSYTQITNCLHVYTEEPSPWSRCRETSLVVNDPYYHKKVTPFPLMDEHHEHQWIEDLMVWIENPTKNLHYNNRFFEDVAKPMAIVWYQHKEHKNGLRYCSEIGAEDWSLACTEWIARRENT